MFAAGSCVVLETNVVETILSLATETEDKKLQLMKVQFNRALLAARL